MKEHYIVTLDRGRLRIYSETRSPDRFQPQLEMVESIDFSSGMRGDTDGDTVLGAGLRPAKYRPAGRNAVGRIPSRRESDRRRIEVLASELDAFLQQRAGASWDFAATPALFDAIVELISPDTRRRLKRVLSEDLANESVDDVSAHFALTA